MNKLLFTFVSVFTFLSFKPDVAIAQGIDNPVFWQQDTVLQAHIDSFGMEMMLHTIQDRMSEAVAYCNSGKLITADSLESWTNAMRWAVIVEDSESLDRMRQLHDLWQTGDSGHLTYGANYTVNLGLYAYDTRDESNSKKTSYLLNLYREASNFDRVFVEDQILAMGDAALDPLITYFSSEFAENMAEVDKEKLAAEDLDAMNAYYNLVDLARVLIEIHQSKATSLRALLDSENAALVRFATDVLED